MGLQYMLVVMLAVVALSVDASLANTESKKTNLNVRLNRVLTDGLSDIGTKRSLRAEKVIEVGNENEERGQVSNIFAKVGRLVKRKKNVDPKVIAKVESARIDSKAMANAVPAIPKELPTVSRMSKEDKTLTKKLNDFVEEKRSLDAVFTSQVMNKWNNGLFSAEGLPMYVRYSEMTAKRGGHDTYGVNLLVTKVGQEKLVKAVNIGLASGDDLAIATADRVRAGLLNKWWKEGRDATDVARFLKGGGVVVPTVNKNVVKLYRDRFNIHKLSPKPSA
ncbi:hypothetical protein PC129_g17606 [Phytophthora cactorum]|uniref:RxLR effector protein n=1 Tax=Phytophthora cactorum TaxID=29920 RepID=A0A329RE69_9STRA|nr:hypothetical protein Pcac1_g28611 [Phytophthora cactorum]KAG2810273.1 hypothetical protein PC111_g15728 [Phytophthora cactorum]KAG2830465.1 hypothetical protein PC112_g7666 [Phytophthora cactorum]KAG2860300.1 hypothetical protein PC113_g8189 [Phytophthora cactorum]KAG2891538.1 hypothetical protein PC114_g16971 [Phytophthora cactorum]